MIDELCKELKIAMNHNPGQTVYDVLTLATELKYPTRRQETWLDKYQKYKYNKSWKLTNEDILTSLKHYNKLRQKNEVSEKSG